MKKIIVLLVVAFAIFSVYHYSNNDSVSDYSSQSDYGDSYESVSSTPYLVEIPEDETELSDYDDDSSSDNSATDEIDWRTDDAEDYLYSVNSSCFSRIGYEYSTNTMWVEFRNSGKIYTYFDFPEDVWEEFSNASSLGRYYNSYIKGRY